MRAIVTSNYRYKNGNFPCLVEGGEQLEDPSGARSEASLYRINARNAFRYLTYGTPLLHGSLFKKANLRLLWINIKSLFVKRDPHMLEAMRKELYGMLENAYRISLHCDLESQDRLEIFVNTLLSNLPFLDPQTNETIFIPQRHHDEWRIVPYTIDKIDISPKKGWRAAFLAEEDRVYAYGLEPQDPHGKPYVLLMGTTYLTGQGFALSIRSDFSAGLSVGESHDLSDLKTWLRAHHNVNITGHSQGGSMAMMIAARYPEHTHQAFCLNPAGLHRDTLRVLNHHLKQCAKQPSINVYTQVNDPVFIYGDFVKGARIYLVDQPHAKQNSYFAAHAHHYLGHPTAHYRRMSEKELNVNAGNRVFANDLKYLADVMLGTLLDMNFIYRYCLHSVTERLNRDALLFSALLMIALISICATLMTAGVLTPALIAFVIPAFATLNPLLAYSLLSTFCIAASALATTVIPTLAYVASKVIYATMFTLTAVGVGVAFTFGIIGIGVKNCLSACLPTSVVTSLNSASIQSRHRLPGSTARSISKLGINYQRDRHHQQEDSFFYSRRRSGPNTFADRPLLTNLSPTGRLWNSEPLRPSVPEKGLKINVPK